MLAFYGFDAAWRVAATGCATLDTPSVCLFCQQAKSRVTLSDSPSMATPRQQAPLRTTVNGIKQKRMQWRNTLLRRAPSYRSTTPLVTLNQTSRHQESKSVQPQIQTPTFDVLNAHPPFSILRTLLVRSNHTVPHLFDHSLTPPRLELHRPCSPTQNLLTCPDFSADQQRGPASIPHLHGLPCCTLLWECPRCGDEEPDMRYKRVCEVRRVGVKVGRDARRDERGVKIGVGEGCCRVM